jgi:DNA-directed RNA polymerase specialized sigma24 family protein
MHEQPGSAEEATPDPTRVGVLQQRIRLVTIDELDAFVDSAAAQDLSRLEADQALMLRLSVEGFDGRTWEQVARALAEYGYAVVLAWARTGLIFSKCREKGIRVLAVAGMLTSAPDQEAEDLARDTVAEAIVAFRERVLKARRWDPAKRASLATFFIGACLLQFPNRYRSWELRWARQRRHVLLDVEMAAPAPDNPEHEVLARSAAIALLARVPDAESRQIVALRADGYALEEIAELTGLSAAAVKSRLHRMRTQLRGKIK